MRKHQRIIFLAGLAAFFLSSCIFTGPAIRGDGKVTEETREIKDFGKIEVSRGLEVFLVPDSLEYVVIEADENLHDAIITAMNDETLEVYTDKFIRSAKSRKVYVHFTQMKGIKSTSGAMIRSQGTVRAKKLEIAASSGSSQTLTVDAGQLEGSFSSGAQVSLSGEAGDATLKASTGAHLKGNNFSAGGCYAKASTGAHIRAGVKNKIVAEASTGGHICYSGNPENTSFDSSSGGLIEKE